MYVCVSDMLNNMNSNQKNNNKVLKTKKKPLRGFFLLNSFEKRNFLSNLRFTLRVLGVLFLLLFPKKERKQQLNNFVFFLFIKKSQKKERKLACYN